MHESSALCASQGSHYAVFSSVYYIVPRKSWGRMMNTITGQLNNVQLLRLFLAMFLKLTVVKTLSYKMWEIKKRVGVDSFDAVDNNGNLMGFIYHKNYIK